MNKNLFSKMRFALSAALLAGGMLFPSQTSAEVLFSETFDYPAGQRLYPQGGWLLSNHKDGTNPIKVSDVKLSYPGFLSGKSVNLTSVGTQDEDVTHACVPRDASTSEVTPITEGDIYIAFLVNVRNVESKNYFFSLLSTNYSMALKDETALTQTARVIAVPSDNSGKFYLGFDKNSNTPSAQSQELDLNTTYLVVLHYGIQEGTTNDTFEAWINPASEQTESVLKTDTNKADLGKGFVGVAISQATSSSLKTPEMLVGPIRVATTWSELFDGGGDTPEPSDKAEIKVSAPALPANFYLMQYQKYTASATVKAKNLTDDITVSGFGTGVTPSVTVIPAEEACSEQGYTLDLALDASAGAAISQTLTLTSGDVQASLPVEIVVQPSNQLMNFRFAPNCQDYEYYYFSGNAYVTYVDTPNQKLYLEDQVGGIVVDYSMASEAAPFKAGDKVKDIYLMAGEKMQNVPQFYLCSYFDAGSVVSGKVTAENTFKTATEATLAAIIDSPEDYINRLVKVNDLSFDAAGETLAAAGTAVSADGKQGRVRPFAGTDAIEMTLPETASVTGISTSMGAAVITVRGASDIDAPQGEAGLTFEPELLVDAKEYYPVNVETPYATIKVKAANMSKATSLWLGGADRNAFSIDREEIPAGTGEYTVNITFKPSKVGRNTAMLNFDTTPTELSKTLTLNALAFDPDNLPEFSVDASSLNPFAAAAGSTQEQTVTISASGLLDYGAIRVLGQGQGAFNIASTSFLKDGQTTLKITFAPKSQGTYSETIEFSTPKAETKTIQVTGTCSEDAPAEDKQGDELVFDTTAPKAKYKTSFDNSGERNKPLSLDGWKNVALEGTRAFWSYTNPEDGNTMAKVTAYDSQADINKAAPAEMLLLSPALDNTDACPARLLQFRVMGDFLTGNPGDQFNVLYIDPALPENERYQVIDGLDIPVIADENGQWREYVIDLENLDLADTFFIGFHYVSTRGRDTTSVYYVDDFSWGDDTTPFIRVDKNVAVVNGETPVGQTSHVGDFTVTGLNLTGKITVEKEGAHKDMFQLNATELPADGGTLSVTYAPTEAGEHAIYLVLKSEGAPATYLTVGGVAGLPSGVSGVDAEDLSGETIWYNLQGERVYKPASGELLIRVHNGKATKILK